MCTNYGTFPSKSFDLDRKKNRRGILASPSKNLICSQVTWINRFRRMNNTFSSLIISLQWFSLKPLELEINLSLSIFQIFFRRSVGRALKHRCRGSDLEDSVKVYLDKSNIQECPRCRLEQCLISGMSLKGRIFQFLSISCSFRQTFCKIIGSRPPSFGLAPHVWEILGAPL